MLNKGEVIELKQEETITKKTRDFVVATKGSVKLQHLVERNQLGSIKQVRILGKDRDYAFEIRRKGNKIFERSKQFKDAYNNFLKYFNSTNNVAYQDDRNYGELYLNPTVHKRARYSSAHRKKMDIEMVKKNDSVIKENRRNKTRHTIDINLKIVDEVNEQVEEFLNREHKKMEMKSYADFCKELKRK